MVTGIYQIRNLKNEKFYIGSAINISQRWRSHRSLLKVKHHSVHLQRAWKKYGADAFVFEILEICEANQCIEREQYYLDILLFASSNDSRFDELGYNICRIAGSTLGIKLSKEHKTKLSIAKTGKYKGADSCHYGKPKTLEHRNKLSKNHADFSGEKHPCAKLTKLQVEEIRILNLSQRKIAKIFNVAQTTISRIKSNQGWRLENDK